MERQVLAVPGVYLARPRQFTFRHSARPVDLRIEMVVFRLERHGGDIDARLSEPVAYRLLHSDVSALPDIGVADDSVGVHQVLGGPRLNTECVPRLGVVVQTLQDR